MTNPTPLPLVYREKKKEQEREELWKKLDDLQIKKALGAQSNSHGLQNLHSNTNNNNSNEGEGSVPSLSEAEPNHASTQ